MGRRKGVDGCSEAYVYVCVLSWFLTSCDRVYRGASREPRDKEKIEAWLKMG